MFAREVNENETMIASLENAILYKVDCEKGEGIALAEKYGIRGYPTYIALNGKGEITDRWIGYDGPEEWAASVNAAKADRRTIAEKKAAFEAEPTLELAQALASDANTGAEYKAAVEYYSLAEEMDPGNSPKYQEQILMAMLYGLEDDSFTMDQVIAKAEPVMASADTPVFDKLELALTVKYFANKKDQLDKAVPFIEAAYAASEGTEDPEALKYRSYLAVDYALHVEKDKDKAYGLFTGRLPEGWEENTQHLNKVAWWSFENEYQLEKAQEMAIKGAGLAANDSDRARILDTAAEICNALGNCDQALEHIRTALELDPDNEYYKDQLVRFEKAAQEKNKG